MIKSGLTDEKCFNISKQTHKYAPFVFSKTKKHVFSSANEASYYGAFDRARNADLDTLKIDFLVDNRSPLVPKQGREGSSVSQHDLIFLKVRIRPRTMAQVVEHAIFLPKTLLFSFIFDRGSPMVPKQGRESFSVSQHD